jgi:pimeloyl-ACP methyl ester carboxylesterase
LIDGYKNITALPSQLPDNSDKLEQLIASYEHQSSPLKQGSEAKIIWYDEHHKEKTPFSLVYLHGFKGSHGEGVPVHQTVARALGCNLYLARLAGHGQITDRPLADMTASGLVRSAAGACRVAEKIGDKVIIMGTSVGGALALYLAGTLPFSNSIAAIVLYSPLVHIYGRYSLLLENGFGRGLLRIFPGEEHQIQPNSDLSPKERRIWYSNYQLSGALAIGEFVQKEIGSELFQRIKCPAFIGYYYKDKYNFDRTVSVAAIKKMSAQLGTPRSRISLNNFPEAHTHVICSPLVSDAVEDVTDSTIDFLAHHLSLSGVGG